MREYGYSFEQAVWEIPMRRIHMMAKAHGHNHGQKTDWGEANIMIRTAQIYEAMTNG